ncbi:peptidase ClpP [Anaerolineae bacterium]|nr:coenzyme A biosynthesis bifunctional protein CoaBC [Anaerolineaceae bacterium]GDX67807.1 peptidase ClpP [Anaerolineae bacterium]
MISVLHNQRVLLGVTGSIAAYKAPDLASKLTQAGALVDVILTDSAARFITALSFESVTGRRVHTDLWAADAHVQHIGLAEGAALLVVAPCSADTLAKLAHGRADNLLTITALAAHCAMLLAPAMDGGMWLHPAVQANLQTLLQRGAHCAGPAAGRMASGQTGIGRMLEPAQLLGHIRLALGAGGVLAGRQIVVTAGGTHEAIDPVRLLTNRSTGKQGFALAQAALDLGAQVTLISGPSALETPEGAVRIDVQTGQQMQRAVLQAAATADALLMAAAVSDYRPQTTAPQKLKRSATATTLALEPNPDVLAAVVAQRAQGGWPRVLVGFAAESENLLENAAAKLRSKQLQLVAANNISEPGAGFGTDTNRVTLLDAQGGVEELPLQSKALVAERICARVAALLQ